ncbi:TraR/DksA family transcriptional regulator [Streptomyces tailanensis]|uniref:TraR/DksA family transcriptional regulator n=1 Tax=Streptomyces tailanensis TaxID=2569858 RepID=UPI00122E9BC7|nr:TraR/DksA family transcriptional regulator [Streptomyces tailanensis]
MVAKKTAVQQSASGRSTVASGGKKQVRVDSEVEADAKKTTARKTATTEKGASKTGAAAAKSVAKKATTKKSAATKGAVKKSTARSAAKGAPAKRTSKKSTTKSTSTKKSTVKKVGAAEAAETTGATTVVAKNTPGTATAAKKPTAVPKARPAAVKPGELAVRPGEDPWSPAEVAEARTELQSEAMRIRAELEASERSLTGLMRDSGDGAGDDQADTGAKNITREHEMALAHNAREMLDQTERALDRLAAGTYGLCENCGNPIGKARMQAFPRATLCVECKQKQERRQ